MRFRTFAASSSLVLCLGVFLFAAENKRDEGFVPLFTEDGVPKGWLVRSWDDLSKPADAATVWTVKRGILHGSEPRGTWLVSEKEYGDFVLEFEFRLGPRGNSGCAIRLRSRAIRRSRPWKSRWPTCVIIPRRRIPN